MRMAVVDPAGPAAFDRAAEALSAALRERDALPTGSIERDAAQDDVLAAVAALGAADRSYFRLSGWGMAKAARTMASLGMLDEVTPPPEFPDRKSFGVSDKAWQEWQAAAWVLRDDTPAPVRYWHAARQRALTYRPAEATGICAFKFRTQDGWLVTPGEIRAALASYQRALLPGRITITAENEPWWDDWIDYLLRAKDCGGFTVN